MQRRTLTILGLGALLALSLTLNGRGLGFALPNHYDPSPDAVHPVMSLFALEEGCGGQHPAAVKYPRAHFVLVGAVQFGALAARHGPGEAARVVERLLAHDLASRSLGPLAVRESYRDFADTLSLLLRAGRAVSAILGALLVLALFLLARELVGPAGGAIAALFAALSYPLVHYAHTLNVDVPYLAWATLALYFAVRAARGGALGALLAAGFFAALAAATKDQAAALFLLPAPLVLALRARPAAPRSPAPGRFGMRAVALAAVLTLAAYALLLGLPCDPRGVLDHFRHVLGEGVAPYQAFPATLRGQLLLHAEMGLHLYDVLGPFLLLAAAVGLVSMARERPRALLLLLASIVSYDLFFLAPILYTYLRFVLPVALLLLVPAGFALAKPLAHPRARWVALLAVALLAAERGRLAWQVGTLLPRDPRVAAQAWLDEHLPKGARVLALLELPMHNLALPPGTDAIVLGGGEPPPRGLGGDPPEFLVTSVFPPPRGVARPGTWTPDPPAEVTQVGRVYDLIEAFLPALPQHPVLRGVNAQPMVLVYRLRGA